MRTLFYKNIEDSNCFKNQLLIWAEQFEEVVFLDSNSYQQNYSSFDFVLAVDAFTSIKTDFINGFEDLKNYQQQSKDWLFGYLSYDLKNDLEALESNNFDGLQFADLYFFQPKKIFIFKENILEVHYLHLCEDEFETDLATIQNCQNPISSSSNLEIKQRIDEESYIAKVTKMLAHIQRGDIYEANFCMEFYANEAVIEPIEIFQKLNAISNTPFGLFFKNKEHYLLCASPERYLRKQGTKVITQPIKGTSRRFSDPILDLESKNALEQNPKERSENIMIVDLVRNDLSRTATKGSVEVEELCGIYSFEQVHQMISTVVSEVESSLSPVDILRTTFPMGSMTGAPKIAAMKIIESLEETKRGIYSGAFGYFSPNNDFDFNVVIRSIAYNATNKYISFSVGSAITSQSNPQQEYEECLLKAKAMFEVLG